MAVIEWWLTLKDDRRRLMLLAGALAVVCVFLFLGGHGRYGLFDVDEAIFTRATIEMRAHTGEQGIGALAMPTYNGEPRYHKPPLIYWAQDVFMLALGEESLYAARLPSGLAAFGTVILLGWGVWRLTRDRVWALTSAAALALSLSFVVIGRAATADGLLNLTSLALALWMLEVLYGTGAVKKRGGRVYGWAVTGILSSLAFLAKGPVAWIPAAVIVVSAWLARKDKRELWARLEVGRSIAVMAMILIPWALLLVSVHGVLFFYEFFVVHNLARYAGGFSNSQSSSPFYYLLVLAVGFFPWVLFLPFALRDGLSNWRKRLASRDLARALPALVSIWAVFYIGFFSFSQTKLVHYIVPAYPALAILVGWWVSRVPRGRIPGWWMGFGVALCVLLGGIGVAARPVLEGLRTPELTGWLQWVQLMTDFEWPPGDELAFAVLKLPVEVGHGFAVAGVLAAAVAVPWVFAAMGRRWALPAMAGLWGVALVVIAWCVVPPVWQYTQAPLARMAQRISDFPPHVPVAHLGLHKPSLIYLSRRPFLKLERPLQLPEYVAKQSEMLVVAEQEKVPQIQLELAAQRRGMILAKDCDGGYCLLVVGRIGDE